MPTTHRRTTVNTRRRIIMSVITAGLAATAVTAAYIVGVVGTGPGSTAVTPPTVAPVRAAFYYPWFPETEQWASQYTPSLGSYDSSNRAVVAAHVSMAQYGGLDAFIASWWGEGSKTAARLPLLLDVAAAHGFHIAPYYEPASLSPTAARVQGDFDALAARNTSRGWLDVAGKPVLFVYNTGTEATCAAVTKYKTAAAGRFYLNLKVFAGYRTCADQPDSWHQYGPAVGYDRQSTYSATVSPGFYKFNENSPRLARDLTRFKADLTRQVASGAQWQLTTTFSEWGEGSSVEPAQEWQTPSGAGAYLDAMRAAYLNPVQAKPIVGSTVTPTPVDPTPVITPTPTPEPTTTGSVVIAAAGDLACAPGYTAGTNCQHKAVSDKILTDNVDRFFALGDLQYEAGSLSGFNASYAPTYGRLLAKTNPVPGNHEYGTPNAAGYYQYFGARAGDPAKGYYAFNVGGWRWYALNSEKDTSASGAQVAWLKADLAANPSKCVGAMWHKPRWSNGSEHGDSATMAAAYTALYNAGADLVLSGHDHDYERFYPRNPAGALDNSRGIVQIVSGEGGKNHYSVSGGTTTAAKDNTSYGYTRLVLNAGSVDVRFVAAVGTYTDTATITCH